MFSSSAFYFVISIVISFFIGILFYYVMKEGTRKEIRQQIDEVVSQLINFVIYIWIGKIVLKFTTFINDPLAVLAYPSDSTAFYFATICILLHILIKYRNKQNISALFNTFLPIFLVSHFTYEFIQTVVMEMKPNWSLLIFYPILIILYMILQDKITEVRLRRFILLLLLTGHLLMALYSNTYIFGYSLGAIYFVGMFIFMFFIIVYSNKKFSITKKLI